MKIVFSKFMNRKSMDELISSPKKWFLKNYILVFDRTL